MALGLLCRADRGGERVPAPFQTIATQVTDMVAALPYAGIYAPEDPDCPAVARSMYLDSVDSATAEVILSSSTHICLTGLRSSFS